jgi:NAD(P)-dependent dehydrogenase (short-subunit alcohol dehydrogenase family)
LIKEKMKNIVVIGAYGGMGRAMTDALLKNGYRVFALDKRIGKAEDNLIPIEVDITSYDSVKNAKSKVIYKVVFV